MTVSSGGDRFRASGVPLLFQEEDGIRDGHVTGVQTCALPISVKPQVCGSFCTLMLPASIKKCMLDCLPLKSSVASVLRSPSAEVPATFCKCTTLSAIRISP